MQIPGLGRLPWRHLTPEGFYQIPAGKAFRFESGNGGVNNAHSPRTPVFPQPVDEDDRQKFVGAPIHHVFATRQQQRIREHRHISKLVPHVRADLVEKASDSRAELLGNAANGLETASIVCCLFFA